MKTTYTLNADTRYMKRTIFAHTIDDLRKLWFSYRDDQALGNSDLLSQTGTLCKNNAPIARMSFNGRLWNLNDCTKPANI